MFSSQEKHLFISRKMLASQESEVSPFLGNKMLKVSTKGSFDWWVGINHLSRQMRCDK